jgi:hypothetical protein
VVRAGSRLIAAAAAAALLLPPAATAQQPPADAPAPPPAAATADSAGDVGTDPVGFLLEHRDSLGLAPAVVDELVQINLDLFRRTRRVQRAIDSIVPPPPEPGFAAPRARPLTPAQRERLAPLLAERLSHLRRARDAAYALLTPAQRDRARDLARQLAARARTPRRR